MVIVAVRLLFVVFLLAVIEIVALFDPLLCDTVHHDWLDLTVHVSLLVIVTVCDSPAAPNDIDVGLTLR